MVWFALVCFDLLILLISGSFTDTVNSYIGFMMHEYFCIVRMVLYPALIYCTKTWGVCLRYLALTEICWLMWFKWRFYTFTVLWILAINLFGYMWMNSLVLLLSMGQVVLYVSVSNFSVFWILFLSSECRWSIFTTIFFLYMQLIARTAWKEAAHRHAHQRCHCSTRTDKGD